MHQDLFTVGAVEQNVMNLLGIILEGSIQIKIIFLRQCPQNSIGKAGLVRTGLPAHDRDGSLIDAESLVRDHQILVEFHLISQAEAYRAGTERIVEGKASGFHFADTDTTVRTGKALAESHRFAADHIHHQQPLCQFQYIFNRVCQTALNTILYHQTIYHDVDIVLDIFIQFDLFRQFIHAAVDPYPDITASLGALQHLGMLALAASDHGGQQLDLRAFSHVHDLIHHLIYSLLGNLSATLRGTVLRCFPHWASPSGPGTVSHRRTGIPCSVSVPLHRSCRMPERTYRNRTYRSIPPARFWECPH